MKTNNNNGVVLCGRHVHITCIQYVLCFIPGTYQVPGTKCNIARETLGQHLGPQILSPKVLEWRQVGARRGLVRPWGALRQLVLGCVVLSSILLSPAYYFAPAPIVQAYNSTYNSCIVASKRSSWSFFQTCKSRTINRVR